MMSAQEKGHAANGVEDELSHAKKASNMGRPKCTPLPYQVPNYTAEDELLCPVPTDPSTCNPYEPPGPYKDFNLMYSRGMAKVLADARRGICVGKGYTFSDLNRNSGVYKYAPDDADDAYGLCKICSTPTAFRCQKCSITFYCSRPCILKDWPQHNMDCQSNPNMVKRIPSAMSMQSVLSSPNGKEKAHDQKLDKWFISEESYECVMITTVMGYGDYFVKKISTCDDMDDMFKDLKAHAASTAVCTKPTVNQVCILRHERDWYRVVIKEIRDHRMNVYFMDYGTFKDVFTRNVVPINGFRTTIRYSGRINADNMTRYKFMTLTIGSFIHVKAISINDNGTPIVEVEEDKKEKALEKLAAFPNILGTPLFAPNLGALLLHVNIAKDKVVASLVPEDFRKSFQSLLEDLSEACNAQVTQEPDYKPILGDFICGQQSNGDWYRGIVFNLNPIKLAVIDEARVFVPVKCTPLPNGYHDIPSFGVIAKLTAAADVAGRTFECKVLKVSPYKNSAMVLLTSDEETAYTGEAILKKWMPKPGQQGILWAEITTGCKVQLVEASRLNDIFVHIMEYEEKERRDLVEREMRMADLDPLPRDSLFVGQFVMVRYKNDNKYYRAHVEQVLSDMDIQVMFIDYGNVANVKIEQLYELPDELKEERACSARIKLKGVEENIPMTAEATDYLTELITHEVPLTCIFTGNPVVDGVVLKTPRNDIVNETLSVFLKSSSEKPAKKLKPVPVKNELPALKIGKVNDHLQAIDFVKPVCQKLQERLEHEPVFTLNDLPAMKLGKVGDEFWAIVLSYNAVPFPSVILASNDENLSRPVHVDIHKKIQEYVKNTPNYYIPRDGELCIALCDGAYYRGVCMCMSATPDESRILFIDDGFTELIKHKDIRKMVEDFMGAGPLATLCSLSPMVLEDKVTPAIQERLRKLLRVTFFTVKIISEDPKDRMLYIDIPEVREKLIKEKLL